MIRADAVIVGGGPAGSTCAGELRRAGWDVRVVDRARFPRDKVCAGWVTPQVFEALDLSPADYRAAGLTLQPIAAFHTGMFGGSIVDTRYDRTVSYAIRRREFDHFLLQRAGVQVMDGTPVETLRRTPSRWIVNDAIETPVVIGAGGHFCPVARHLRGGGRDVAPAIVAKEAEFLRARYAPAVDDAPALYFCRDLDGYAWCVPKGDYLNVGIGRRDHRDFNAHVGAFITLLESLGIHAADPGVQWHGHAYLARGAGARPLIDRGVMLIGDAAGLAYPESGEGICPAIESGLLAARTLIAARGRHDIDDLRPYAAAMAAAHPPAAAQPAAWSAAIGRWLLRSPAFTRHVVLNRWFLRPSRPPLITAAVPA